MKQTESNTTVSVTAKVVKCSSLCKTTAATRRFYRAEGLLNLHVSGDVLAENETQCLKWNPKVSAATFYKIPTSPTSPAAHPPIHHAAPSVATS